MENQKTIEELVAEVDAEFAAEAEQSVTEENPTEEGDGVSEEETQELSESESQAPEENQETEVNVEEQITEDAVDHKKNEAFKNMRLERDKYAESDKFLEDLAASYGLTKDQLVERFKNDQAKKEAEESGMTPEQYKEMQDMKTRLAEVETSKQREVFNIKAEGFAQKHSLNQEQMVNLFTEAGKLGLDVLSNPDLLEFVYKATNYEAAIEQGRQQQLADSKRRRETSTGNTGLRGQETIITQEEQWDREIDELMKTLNI